MSNHIIEHGDRVTALGMTFTVDKILYQDCCGGTWDIEFIDPRGAYHHWKQNLDGGTAARWNGRTWAPLVPGREAE